MGGTTFIVIAQSDLIGGRKSIRTDSDKVIDHTEGLVSLRPSNLKLNSSSRSLPAMTDAFSRGDIFPPLLSERKPVFLAPLRADT